MTAILLTVAALAVAVSLLAVVYRAQVRRYNRAIATEFLNDWRLQVELMAPADRERALLSPPPNVLAAMASLPAKGMLRGWNEAPVASFNRVGGTASAALPDQPRP
jgi:hypothetical protein